MKFILGQKKQMTQIFKSSGTVIPVTVVKALPNVITQVKTEDTDGYDAVQVGSGATKKNIKKSKLGHLKDLQQSRWLREFRIKNQESRIKNQASVKGHSELDSESNPESQEILKLVQCDVTTRFKRGMRFGVEIFKSGDRVRVTGVSKGRGFQGVVKRHGFHGAPASHGTKDQLRMPGSIGATGPAHVFKGRKMPGRMGNDQVTIDGLEVVKVDKENNLLYINGALPGAFSSLVMISGPGTMKITENTKEQKTQIENTLVDENKESGIKNQGEQDINEEVKEADAVEVNGGIEGSDIENKQEESKDENKK